jgi:hypothetical protein
MSRFLCSVMVAVAVVTVVAAPTSAAPDEDFVTGTGEIFVVNFPFGPVVLSVFIDAHSDASGGNPSGSFAIFVSETGTQLFSGPVTCLHVTGDTATVGVDDRFSGPSAIQVVDNSAAGSPDTFGIRLGGVTDCTEAISFEPYTLVSGDLSSTTRCR